MSLNKSPPVRSPCLPSYKIGLAWLVSWALTLRASVSSLVHKWEPQQVLEEGQALMEPWFSHLLASPGDPTQSIAGILRPCRREKNVASATLTPQFPLTVRTMPALPPPWEQHFVWNVYQAEEEGLGPHNFCTCSNRKQPKVWGQGKQVQGHPGNQQPPWLGGFPLSPHEEPSW